MPRYQDPKEADRIMRAAGAIPLEPYKGSQVKWMCKCKKCKKIIYPSLAPIKNKGISPCQKCAALEMGARRRAKSEVANIAILKKAHFVPLEEFPGSGKPWRVRCLKCKKESKPHLSSVKNGSSCGYCAGLKIDESDVRKIHKKAGFEPIGKYPGNTKILWKTKHKKCGVTSSPTFASIRKGGGCRTCSGTLLVTPLAARKLFLRNKLEPIEPYKDTQSSWKSKCLVTGKIVSPTYGKVRDYGHRCKYCSENVTDAVDAIALMKKAGFKTIAPFPGGQKPWKSQCLKCKKIFSPNFTSVKMGHGCKYCTQSAVDPEDAVAAMKKRGFRTLGEYPGATKPWAVQCLKCKKKFDTTFHSLNTKNRCKFCSGVALDKVDIDRRLKELKLKPLVAFPGARVPWKLECLRCKRTVTPTFSHLTRNDRNVGGCSFCSRRRIHMDDIVKLMARKKLKPIGVYVNSNSPWLSQCLKCKREVQPRLSDLRQGQSGCIYCAGLRIDEKDAIKLANKNGFTPLVPYPGANKGWECICNICGQVSKPNYTSMQQGVNRCKFCATGGFDFNSPAIIYLISHTKLGAHKIGVAGAAKHNERLAKHASQGWIVYKHKEFKKGIDAFNLEGKILHWLRYKKNLSPYLSIEQMPQAGWSETVDASEINLPTIWAKVEQLSKVKR